MNYEQHTLCDSEEKGSRVNNLMLIFCHWNTISTMKERNLFVLETVASKEMSMPLRKNLPVSLAIVCSSLRVRIEDRHLSMSKSQAGSGASAVNPSIN